jgi:excisionase family DNA binding protein
METLFSVKQVSELLHVHGNTVRRWSDRGILQPYRIGSRGDRRFKKVDINQFRFRLIVLNGDERKVSGSDFYRVDEEDVL